MSTEAIIDVDSQPTAVVIGRPEDLPPLEIGPPERHLAGIAVQRQVETVLDFETDTDEYPMPTLRNEGLIQRVRIEMHKRRVHNRLFGRYVEKSS